MKIFHIVTSFDNMPLEFLEKIRLIQGIVMIVFISANLICEYVYAVHVNSLLLFGLILCLFYLGDTLIGLKIKIIGAFSFDETSFEKSIGDLGVPIEVENIRLVNIEKHLVYLMPFFRKTMYRTFVVSIMTYDGARERFVVDNSNGAFMHELKQLKTKRPDLIRIGNI